jgi:hypothetical protein
MGFFADFEDGKRFAKTVGMGAGVMALAVAKHCGATVPGRWLAIA